MTVATQRRMSLEEYLTYDDGTDTRYELVDGVLVEMGSESTINTWIASFIFGEFIRLGLPAYRVGFKQRIQVNSNYVTARDPDLIVHSQDSAQFMEGRREAILKLREPNPLVVVEVVSPGNPGEENYDRDYIEKRAEYAARGIPEYWLIDPVRQVVLILTLGDGSYDSPSFTGSQSLKSPAFPAMALTAEQVLTAGRS
jgi:Uma2 family endonuclease